MDWYPLLNPLRIAAVSCVIVFFLGILCACCAVRVPREAEGALDGVTLFDSGKRSTCRRRSAGWGISSRGMRCSPI